MRISAHLGLWGSIVFALVCLYVAWDGFSSLDASMSGQVLDDARGFAWFWLFLAAVGAASAVASWWILRNSDGETG